MTGMPGDPLGVRDGASIWHADVADLYDAWPAPDCIISDGAYGLGGFPGDPRDVGGLAGWYRPHVAAWTRRATPRTTLWFWNTEVGWATVHPLLVEAGWEYRACCTWNKGTGHIAGNVNTATLQQLPVVTEVCVHYRRPPFFRLRGTGPGPEIPLQQWLRSEWARAGLTLHEADVACGVRNAASRKYLTKDRLWYPPPDEALARMAAYADRHGDPAGVPYLSVAGSGRGATGGSWEEVRAAFHCPFGVTNVWEEPPVDRIERLRIPDGKGRIRRLNQKPLRLVARTVALGTDPGGVVWEPFGSTCPAALAAHRQSRRCCSAESIGEIARAAVQRLDAYDGVPELAARALGTGG
jgi:site-specific DNA-methyltransferase (adenine-specific)